MVRKKDLVKIFYIYICLCHVCPAHPCGDNPLRNIISYSEKSGHALKELLGTFRGIDSDAYERLRHDFQHYRQCIGMVDTGYFKRSWEGQSTAEQLPRELSAYSLYTPSGKDSDEDILRNDEPFPRDSPDSLNRGMARLGLLNSLLPFIGDIDNEKRKR